MECILYNAYPKEHDAPVNDGVLRLSSIKECKNELKWVKIFKISLIYWIKSLGEVLLWFGTYTLKIPDSVIDIIITLTGVTCYTLTTHLKKTHTAGCLLPICLLIVQKVTFLSFKQANLILKGWLIIPCFKGFWHYFWHFQVSQIKICQKMSKSEKPLSTLWGRWLGFLPPFLPYIWQDMIVAKSSYFY